MSNLNSKIKVAASIIIVIVMGYVIYLGFTPRIKVENLTGQQINKIEIQHPKISFTLNDFPSGAIVVTEHIFTFGDGSYQYSISLQTGESVKGTCTYSNTNNLGKMIYLVIRSATEIECNP